MKNKNFPKREYWIFFLVGSLLTFIILMSFIKDNDYNNGVQYETEIARVDSIDKGQKQEKDSVWKKSISDNIDTLFLRVDSLGSAIKGITKQEVQHLKVETEIKHTLKQYLANQSK